MNKILVNINNDRKLFTRLNQDIIFDNDNIHLYCNKQFEYKTTILDNERINISNSSELWNPKYLFVSLYSSALNKIKIGIFNKSNKKFTFDFRDNTIVNRKNQEYLGISGNNLITSSKQFTWMLEKNVYLKNVETNLYICIDNYYNLFLSSNIKDATALYFYLNGIHYIKPYLLTKMELINIKQKISLKSDLILHKDKDRTDNIGIILASGTSTRFRQKKQKQIYPINYIPMFVYSLDVFLNTLDEVVIVTNKDCVEQMKNIIDRVYKDDKKLIHFIINDVDSRMESINLALDFIDKNRTNTKNIVIHDCCIPFVKEEMIELILEELSNINVYHSQYYLEIENETIYKNVDGFFKPDDFDGIIKLSTPFGIDFKLCCFLFNSYMKNNRITREFIFLFKVLNIKYSLIKGYENELKKIVYIDDIDDTIEIHKSKTLSSKNIIDLS